LVSSFLPPIPVRSRFAYNSGRSRFSGSGLILAQGQVKVAEARSFPSFTISLYFFWTLLCTHIVHLFLLPLTSTSFLISLSLSLSLSLCPSHSLSILSLPKSVWLRRLGETGTGLLHNVPSRGSWSEPHLHATASYHVLYTLFSLRNSVT
jgi:hypothetical protein